MNFFKWLKGDKVETLLSADGPGLTRDEKAELDFQIRRSMLDRERVERLLESSPRTATGSPIADIFGGRVQDETG